MSLAGFHTIKHRCCERSRTVTSWANFPLVHSAINNDLPNISENDRGIQFLGVFCKRKRHRERKDTAHTSSYATDLDYLNLETKPTVARNTTVGCWISNKNETRLTGRAGIEKIEQVGIKRHNWDPGAPNEYPEYDKDTTVTNVRSAPTNTEVIG
jgi:hypothetical protein